MGDNGLLHKFAEFQPAHHAPVHRTPPTLVPEETANGDDEDYTIRCVCDFNDDDGNTVLCERCNTWQHIICYYFPRESLDDDFHHSCVICNPRHVDSHQANLRQHQRRDPIVTEEKKARRTNPKNHKKAKTIQVNGVSDHVRTDGRDGSPRDGAPPAKRPKTSHRHSGSMASAAGHQRARASSTIKRRPTLHELPHDYFSPDFFQAQHNQQFFRPSTANLHLNIAFTDLLSRWLDDEECFSKITNGKTHQDVFMHLSQPMEELDVPVAKHIEAAPDIEFHGHQPLWHKLKASRDITTGEFVGELCGTIGLQDDYKNEPANKWTKLRHPNHFVFFHPILPIYIDCRAEGTVLRYARRSCHPTVRISTLITGAREYRFCFTALHDIQEGQEITVGWDSDPDLSDKSEARIQMTDFLRDQFSSRAEALLSHFGGCACEAEPCLMLHFDRRIREQPGLVESPAEQTKTSTKKRKTNKKSPTDTTHISRASSEAITHGDADGDEDMDDGRSTSQSTKLSRDNTPSGANGTGANEMSAREKRKLMQSEKLFEQIDAQKRKKRNSGSTSHVSTDALNVRIANRRPLNSHPNTPISATKPRSSNGVSYFANHTRASPDVRSPASAGGQARSETASPKSPRVPPVYRDNSTQTVSEEPSSPPRRPKIPYLSLSRRLMQRSFLSQQHFLSHGSSDKNSIDAAAATEDGPVAQAPEPEPRIPSPDIGLRDPNGDVVMSDGVPQAQIVGPATSAATDTFEAAPLPLSLEKRRAARPPLPPWPVGESMSAASEQRFEEKADNVGGSAASPLHVELPPPPSFVNENTVGSNAIVTTPNSTPSVAAQSPPNGGPSPTNSAPLSMLSPSLEAPMNAALGSAAVRPSPVKKKMSLSDYLKKNKRAEPPVASSDAVKDEN